MYSTGIKTSMRRGRLAERFTSLEDTLQSFVLCSFYISFIAHRSVIMSVSELVPQLLRCIQCCFSCYTNTNDGDL